jgi:hypothetical protein
MINIKRRLDPRNAQGGLACLGGLGAAQIVQPTPGMGFDIGERFVLARQVVQHPAQQRVLLDIGQVPGVIAVLIGKHRLALVVYPAHLQRAGI